MAERFKPNTKQELVDAVHLWITNREEAIQRYQDVNDWDTSQITDMSRLFASNTNNHTFNSPIDRWDTSNVTNMNGMFYGNKHFNQPLNTWNVSQVKDMGIMFGFAKAFNQPLNDWNVGQVIDMESMFLWAERFNQPLDSWNTSSVQMMEQMFFGAFRFNQPLDMWDVHNVEEHDQMFNSADMFDRAREPHFNRPERQPEPELVQRQRIQIPVEPIPITQYNNVKTVLLPTITKPLSNVQTAFDFISGEDIPIREYLQESNDNLVFEFNGQFFAATKSSILKHVIPNNSNIKYKCPNVNSLRNLVKTVPYLSLRSMGIIAGVCLLGEIKTVLTTPTIQWVQIGNEVIENLPSTASLSVLLPGANFVSASHCQEGQGESVRKLVHVIINSGTGGSRKRNKRNKKTNRKTKRNKKTNRNKKKKINRNKKKSNKRQKEIKRKR